MEVKLVYEDTENQMGVDEEGNIIDLCLNENNEERDIDSEAAFRLIKESIITYQMKNTGICYDDADGANQLKELRAKSVNYDNYPRYTRAILLEACR